MGDTVDNSLRHVIEDLHRWRIDRAYLRAIVEVTKKLDKTNRRPARQTHFRGDPTNERLSVCLTVNEE